MPPSFRARPAVLFLAFFLLSVAVYSPSLDNSFRDDDFVFLQHVLESGGLSELLKPSPAFAFYRPGALALFDLEVELLGTSEGGRYLILNFLVHTLNSLLLILVLLELSLPHETSFLAGGLFVLGFGHYGKQVMWACTIGPLVSVLLVLCSVLLAMKYFAESKTWYLPLIAILVLLAASFHEIGIAAPFLVAVAWIMRGNRPGRRWVLLSIGGIAIVAWLSIYVMLSWSHESYRQALHMFARVPAMVVLYLGFMMAPIQRSALVESHAWPFGLLLKLSHPLQVALGISAMAATAIVAIRGRRQWKFIVLWLYVALVPFCLIRLPAGWLELRYVYFAAMPFCALFSSAVVKLFVGGSRPLRAAAIALLVAAAAMSSYVVHILENQYDAQSQNDVNRKRMEDIRHLTADGS